MRELDAETIDPISLASISAELIRLSSNVESHAIAVIIGSGWRNSFELMGQVNVTLRADEVPGFYSSGVSGHSGVIRFLQGFEGFPLEDILRFYFDDGTRVIARPSGTEPKVKFCIDTEGNTAEETHRTLAAVEADVKELVSSL